MKIRNQRVRYGPFTRTAHPGVPADHFTPRETPTSRQLRKALAKIDREMQRRKAAGS